MKNAKWMESKLKMPKGRANNNLDAYLDRVYNANKAIVDSTIDELMALTEGIRIGPGITDPKRWFKNTIKTIMYDKSLVRDIKPNDKPKMTVKEAVDLLGKSTDFVSPEERSLQNIVKAIRKDENFRRFRKMLGYNKEIDWNQLSYQGMEGKATIFYYGNIRIEAPWDSKYGHLNFYIT